MPSIQILWPYEPGPGRPLDQVDVVVTLDDESRWLCPFYDTHRFNKNSKSFGGLGPEQPFRFQKNMIIVSELSDSVVESTIEALLASGEFKNAFELLDAAPAPE